MAAMDVVIQSLAGTADQTEMNSWALSGLHEILNTLPDDILNNFATESTLTNVAPQLANVNLKRIFTVTREEADSGPYITCREVDLNTFNKGNDTNSLYRATIGSPMYNINKNILSIWPEPTAAQNAKGTHFEYPSEVDVSAINENIGISSLTPNITQLVILFTAIKVLQNKMNEMYTNSDVNTALGKLPTELNKVDDIIVEASNKIDAYYSSIGDIENTNELWDGTNKRFKEIRDALLMAKETLDTGWSTNEDSGAGNDVTGIKSVGYWLDDEDVEMSSATLQAAATELRRAETSIAEIGALMSSYKLELEGVPMFFQEATSYINQAQGYISEANARISIDSQRYQWYQAQQAKLQQDYDKGVQLLIGGSTIEK